MKTIFFILCMSCNLLFASDLNRFRCLYSIQKDTSQIFIHESRLLSVIKYLETKISYQYENAINDFIKRNTPFVLIEIISDNTFYNKNYLITQEEGGNLINNSSIKSLRKPKTEFNHILETAKLAASPNRLFDGYAISGKKSSLLSSPAIFTFLTVYDGKRLYCSVFYNLKILLPLYGYGNKEYNSYIKQGECIRKIIEELDDIDYNIL